MTSERMKNLHELIRYGNTLTLTINNNLFKEHNTDFKNTQEALKELKKDLDLEITETCHTKLKLKPNTTRTITIKMKQPTRGMTPREKHHRFKNIKPVKKPRYDWSQPTYLRIKDPETMKRIKAHRLISMECKGQMNF